MNEVPPLSSITSLFGDSEAPSAQGPTHGTVDTAPSPSKPPLTLQGVGTYDPSVGVSLADAESVWDHPYNAPKEGKFWVEGTGIDLDKDGSGEFRKDDTHVTWKVRNRLRDIRLEEKGPEGTIHTALKDKVVKNAYDEFKGRTGRETVSVCYRIPPTKAGQNTRVGLQWVSPYVPNTELPYSPYKPKRRDLVVPSVAFDGLSSKYNPDGSLNLRKLNVAKPLSRFSSNHPLSARLTTEGQAPDMIVTEGF
jgi:hypothetical protein